MTRCRLLLSLLLAALAASALFTTAACAAPAPSPLPPTLGGSATSGGTGAATSGAPTTATSPVAAGGVQSDWQHTVQVIANLRAAPPGRPVVYLLGGSVARECTISEASWAAAVRNAGGPAALTFDLASSNRTTAQDVQLVAKMPAGVPTIVLIGMNVGRFTPAPSTPSFRLPAPVDPLPAWQQHKYSTLLPRATKRALVTKWMQRRYPLFKQHYTYNLGQLEKLIKACKAKGFHPVLFDLPRDLPVIGTKMDAPVNRYHRSCAALATKYRIPFVDFEKRAGLINGDFYDLWHLIKPGRAKWQPLLAKRTAALLLKYGMGATSSTSPSPAP